MATKTDITLYTGQTPNGIKISIALEELGLQYEVYTIKMMENEQKQPWFLDINPNGRLPAITDTLPNGDKIRVFESGAILEYLVERYDKDHKISYPRGSAECWEVTSWVFAPSLPVTSHFLRFFLATLLALKVPCDKGPERALTAVLRDECRCSGQDS
ncbi:hypothetical protein E4U43_001052 [Claviceps pusilla]|uniref:GST N-terminal domain-containing protein n=1 Tax=Claviceps pusilla TaxID=123648 RepID=A0A9P7N8Y5_9HYPO|nr:hypothetical protein E4U43_001052 [Claviceps pusilla]